MHRDEVALLDIATAARQIQKFIDGLTREAFIIDPKTQSAILHQLLLIGEATKRLSDEFRSENSEIQ